VTGLDEHVAALLGYNYVTNNPMYQHFQPLIRCPHPEHGVPVLPHSAVQGIIQRAQQSGVRPDMRDPQQYGVLSALNAHLPRHTGPSKRRRLAAGTLYQHGNPKMLEVGPTGVGQAGGGCGW
jgi:hypothetical protein